MSGFDKNWLALREPADDKARAASLVEQFCHHLTEVSTPAVLDIGCGTGSTWRSLSAQVPTGTQWRLLDHDPELLAEAERRIGHKGAVTFNRFDLNRVEDLPLNDVAVVTASALFDLCSADFCNRFAQTLRRNNVALYAALNYDGRMEWSIRHPLDQQVVSDFNQHQHFDKGFGPALGPNATEHLRLVFEAHHYHTAVATSPWMMGAEEEKLQIVFLQGLEKPLMEIGSLSKGEIAAWLDFRLHKILEPGSSCVVGHTDILALPPH
jgi:SAM-dependent methyltransferase